MNLKPYDHMKECYHRGMMPLEDFAIKEKGEVAEKELANYLDDVLPEGWKMERNVWFHYNRNHEVDILITSSKFVLALECKNYGGAFEYKEGGCYLNGKSINDQIGINDNRKRRLENILAENGLKKLPVYTAIIFMNNECDVQSDKEIGFPLIMRYRLERYIKKMIYEYDLLRYEYPIDRISVVLGKYQVSHPYPPESLSLTEFDKLKKGVHCGRCYSYKLELLHKTVVCPTCGYRETKSEAKKRTAAELGMLFYKEDKILTPKNIAEFVGGVFTSRAMTKELSKTWPSYGKFRGTYYHNYGSPYENVKTMLPKIK